MSASLTRVLRNEISRLRIVSVIAAGIVSVKLVVLHVELLGIGLRIDRH